MSYRSYPRIAIYSQDGFGLGHLRRNSVIGQHLLEEIPRSKILLFADSPVAPFFHLPEGMDHIKLPSVKKVRAGKWQPTHLHMRITDLRRIRAELLRNALKNYQPDVVLVDHMPHGSQGELLPSLKMLKQLFPRCTLVLGLRDILDAQEVIKHVWEVEGAYQALREYYDSILIYGTQEVFDTANIYQIGSPQKGIHYCGYVATKQPPVRPVKYLPPGFQESGKKLVFVSAGGGADGAFLLRNYVRAIRRLGARANFHTLMSAGASSPIHLRQKLIAKTEKLPIDVVHFVDDSLSVIAAADLVVCMGGYNTLSEVLHLKKKALVVPRSGPSAEQRMRCQLFAGLGLIDVMSPEDVTPENLGNRILSDLAREDFPATHKAIETTGGRKAAACLIDLMSTRLRRAYAAG